MMEGDILQSEQQSTGFKLSEVIIIVIITCTFSAFAGISYGRIKYSDSITIKDINTTDESNVALNEFIKNYKQIINNYYDQSQIDEEELLNIALESIINKLGLSDEHSLYMDDEQYSNFNINLDGTYTGLGISAGKENESDYITVVRIIEDSPAAKQNIKPGDKIISIDGKDTKTMTTQEFSQYVLKGNDKIYLLKLKRGSEIITVNIEKATIVLKSVASKVISLDEKKIGYIYVSIFASNTYSQFKKQLDALQKQNIDGLIIDLRENSGGHLKAATRILSLFLDSDKVIYQLQKGNKKVKYYSKGEKDYKYPIVFIGNGGTASASEVLIISLKENLGAKLVGTKTYGKGTVQEMIELSNGDKYKITTQKWLSPKGIWINDTKGINPDIEVELTDTSDNQLKEAQKEILKMIENNK